MVLILMPMMDLMKDHSIGMIWVESPFSKLLEVRDNLELNSPLMLMILRSLLDLMAQSTNWEVLHDYHHFV